MDFKDPSDIASTVAILTVVLSIFAWLIRRWISDQMEKQVMPRLEKHEHSVTNYDEQARSAASAARDAAVAARTAALDAKSAALSAAEAAEAAVKPVTEEG